MNTLTQEQINDLLRENTCWHMWKALSSGITSSATREDIDDLVQAAFALGVAQERGAMSEHDMQVVIYKHTKLNPNQSADVELIKCIVEAYRNLDTIRSRK